MSSIHYFQRYSGKENTVTNNVLHLFSRIYEYSPTRLQKIFTEVIQEHIPLGVSFEQQVKSGSRSIPDGIVFQEPFCIKIETKVGSELTRKQLFEHCKKFPTDISNFLLVITRKDSDKKLVEEIQNELSKKKVLVVHCSFNKLCKVIKEEFLEYETAIKDIVDDFEMYCHEMALISKRTGVLRIVPCKYSSDFNKKFACYYQPSSRGYSPHDYIGIYGEKRVQFIGKIKAVIDAELKGGKLRRTMICGDPTNEFDTNIVDIMRETKEQLGWDITKGHRFFCTEKMCETNYKKASKGGLRNTRILNISEIVEKHATIEKIAEYLRSVTWE